MKKRGYFFLTLFLFTSGVYAEEETLSISTYYPAPYGVYNTLRIMPSSQPLLGVREEGEIYFNSSNHLLYIWDGSAWVESPGNSGGAGGNYWRPTGGSGEIYYNDPFGGDLSNGGFRVGNVGIGRPPLAKSSTDAGYVDVADIWLRSGDDWAINFIQGYWAVSPFDSNDIYNLNSGNVGISTGTIDSKLTIGTHMNGGQLEIENASGTPIFFASSTHTFLPFVGIGTEDNSYGLDLDINGSFRLNNGAQQAGYRLTQIAGGFATWQPPIAPAITEPQPGGLYGWCRKGSGPCSNAEETAAKSPCQCIKDSSPSCLSGYTIRRMRAAPGPAFYACYKN